MDIKTAKQALEAIRAQKAELDSLLGALCGGAPMVGPMVPGEAIYGSDPYVALIGKGVYIRQATFHLIGKLESVGANELALSDASTVFSSGPLGAFLGGANAAEAEPMGRVIVHRGGIIDACERKLK